MILVVDIGNTNVTFGVYNKSIIEIYRLPSNRNLTQSECELFLSDLLNIYSISECVIGSVVDELTNIIKESCDKVFNIESFLINSDINCGMDIKLKNPKEIGVDRLANAYCAKTKYSLPIIVVDIGTATTFDIVSKVGDFVGGVIMPGLNLQIKSLNINTSKLPEITVGNSANAIGDSTEEAILSGIIRGSACAIEGLIHQCEVELGEKATVIATGGFCQLISKYMVRKFDYIEPNLTLNGLILLSKLNNLLE